MFLYLSQTIPELCPQRLKAHEEIQKACKDVGATFHHIQFQKLDFGEMNVLDLFYNADVAIVDLSILVCSNNLFCSINLCIIFEIFFSFSCFYFF